MRTPILEGKKIFLTGLTQKVDFEKYASWLNDQPTTLFMASGRFPVTVTDLKAYINHYMKLRNGMLFGIFLKKGKRHVGNITLHQIDYQNRFGEIGIILGEKSMRGKGIGTEAIRLVVEHAFLKLNLHKVGAGIVHGNVGSLKAFQKAGFKIEGALREQFYLNKKYLTVYRLGLLHRELK